MKAHRTADPHGNAEEMAARKRGGATHRAMLKTGGACERKHGGSIPGEAEIKKGEAEDDRKRGGKVHGEKPHHRGDKRARGGEMKRADGGRMTPKSPLTGAGGGKTPYPTPEMQAHNDGGQGKISQRKRGGHIGKRAMGGEMPAGPTSGAGQPPPMGAKRGGKVKEHHKEHHSR